MKITLNNKVKSNAIFFVDRAYNNFVIYSPKYEIEIYRNLDWNMSDPWIACRNIKIDEDNILIFTPHFISNDRNIFVRSHIPKEKLRYFLQELHDTYNIEYQIYGDKK